MKSRLIPTVTVMAIGAVLGCSDTLTGPFTTREDVAALGSPPTKVAVCHWATDAATWKLLAVAFPALADHLVHGDGIPGEAVPGSGGSQVFGAACEVVATAWEVLVSEIDSHTIRRIASDGLSFSTFFAGVPDPRGIVIEADGSVVVVELGGRLRRIAPDGSSSSVFFTGLSGTSGIAIMPGGDFVVTEDWSPYRLVRVAPDGSSSSVIATGIHSEDVEVDRDGNIIVLQETGGLLLRVTPTGTITPIYDGLVAPVDLAIDQDGSIVVAEYTTGIVRTIAADGSSATVLATGLPTLEGLVILPGGDLLVAEVFTGRLTRIGAGGGILGTFFQGLAGPDHMAIRVVW